MYNQLKAESVAAMRRDFVVNSRRDRVIFLTGIRRDESKRRKNRPIVEVKGSEIWVNPFINWTKLDLSNYRNMFDVPRNEVSDLLHMSGECLCGAFAKSDELDEVRLWFPDVAAQIDDLERKVSADDTIDDKYCVWGWEKRNVFCG